MATKNGRRISARRAQRSCSSDRFFEIIKANHSVVKPASRELRLLTPKHFNFVFQQPQRASSPEATILGRQNELGHPRIGLTIAKKKR